MERKGVEFVTDIDTWEDEAWCYSAGRTVTFMKFSKKAARKQTNGGLEPPTTFYKVRAEVRCRPHG
jgi:hypothetical protein